MTQQRKYFFYSLAIHVAILFALALNLSLMGQMPVLENTPNPANIIEAAVVAQPLPVHNPPPKPTPMPEPKLTPPPKAIVESNPKPALAPKSVPVVKPDVIGLKVQPKKKKVVEQKANLDQMLKDLAAQELLADLKKQTEQHPKKKTKQVDFNKTLKLQAAKALQQQLLSEQSRLESAQSQKMQGVVDKYKALVLQAISQNWLIPGAVNKSLRSELMIRTAPGGMVLDVQLVRSSGNPAFDRSVRVAVFKASPLPVPTDPDAYEQFRQFVLKVRPQDIIASESLID